MVKLIFQVKYYIFSGRIFLENKYLFFLGDLGKFRLKTLTSGTNMLILFDNFLISNNQRMAILGNTSKRTRIFILFQA